MSVYLDSPKSWGWKMYGKAILSCHMVADSEAELHAFARKLGLKRTWYQGRAATPHYDITEGKAEQAQRLGAVLLDDKQFEAKVDEIRIGIKNGQWHDKGRAS